MILANLLLLLLLMPSLVVVVVVEVLLLLLRACEVRRMAAVGLTKKLCSVSGCG